MKFSPSTEKKPKGVQLSLKSFVQAGSCRTSTKASRCSSKRRQTERKSRHSTDSCAGRNTDSDVGCEQVTSSSDEVKTTPLSPRKIRRNSLAGFVSTGGGREPAVSTSNDVICIDVEEKENIAETTTLKEGGIAEETSSIQDTDSSGEVSSKRESQKPTCVSKQDKSVDESAVCRDTPDDFEGFDASASVEDTDGRSFLDIHSKTTAEADQEKDNPKIATCKTTVEPAVELGAEMMKDDMKDAEMAEKDVSMSRSLSSDQDSDVDSSDSEEISVLESPRSSQDVNSECPRDDDVSSMVRSQEDEGDVVVESPDDHERVSDGTDRGISGGGSQHGRRVSETRRSGGRRSSLKTSETRARLKQEKRQKIEEMRNAKRLERKMLLEEKRRKKIEFKKELQEKKDKEKQEKESEKFEKNKQKEAERQLKEKEREEKRKLKEEKKQLKDQARLQKEEDRRREEEERERKLNRSRSMFTNFFTSKTDLNESVCSATGDEADKQTSDNTFMQFRVKDDMMIAPIKRRHLTREEIELLESVISAVTNTAPNSATSQNLLYLHRLTSGEYCAGSCGRTMAPHRSSIDNNRLSPDIIVLSCGNDGAASHRQELNNDDEDDEDDDLLALPPAVTSPVTNDESPSSHLHQSSSCERYKLLQFWENRRPAYWGTWRRRSQCVHARKPLAKDQLISYEDDSDDDWEDEDPDGESLGGSEKEVESDDDYEVDNEFFVPHGYLSDEEVKDEEPMAMSPESYKASLKAKEVAFEKQLRRKTRELKPRVIGCIWQVPDHRDQQQDQDQVHQQLLCMLGALSIFSFTNLPVALESSLNSSTTVAAGGASLDDSVANLSVISDATPGSGGGLSASQKRDRKLLKAFPQEAVAYLARMVHGSCRKRLVLAREFSAFWNVHCRESCGVTSQQQQQQQKQQEEVGTTTPTKLSVESEVGGDCVESPCSSAAGAGGGGKLSARMVNSKIAQIAAYTRCGQPGALENRMCWLVRPEVQATLPPHVKLPLPNAWNSRGDSTAGPARISPDAAGAAAILPDAASGVCNGGSPKTTLITQFARAGRKEAASPKTTPDEVEVMPVLKPTVLDSSEEVVTSKESVDGENGQQCVVSSQAAAVSDKSTSKITSFFKLRSCVGSRNSISNSTSPHCSPRQAGSKCGSELTKSVGEEAKKLNVKSNGVKDNATPKKRRLTPIMIGSVSKRQRPPSKQVDSSIVTSSASPSNAERVAKDDVICLD